MKSKLNRRHEKQTEQIQKKTLLNLYHQQRRWLMVEVKSEDSEGMEHEHNTSSVADSGSEQRCVTLYQEEL